LIWQIYPQSENTHLEKLQAWLNRTGLPKEFCELMLSWNPESLQSRPENHANVPAQEGDTSKIKYPDIK